MREQLQLRVYVTEAHPDLPPGGPFGLSITVTMSGEQPRGTTLEDIVRFLREALEDPLRLAPGYLLTLERLE